MPQQRTIKIGLSNADKTNMATDIRKLVVAQLFATYSSSTTYDIGEFCQYDGTIYKCVVAITTAEAWNSEHWAVAKLNEVINAINEAVASVDGKANVDGNYPTMTVGLAQGIDSDRVIDDADVACPPIVFGTTGGEAEIQSGINKLKALYGYSLVKNQHSSNFTDTTSGVDCWQGVNGTVSNRTQSSLTFTTTAAYTTNATRLSRYTINFNPVTGHKYLSTVVVESTNQTSKVNLIVYDSSQILADTLIPDTSITNKTALSNIITFTKAAGNYELRLGLFASSPTVGDIYNVSNLMVIDLTQMFGAGNEPTTVNEYFARVGQVYIPYNTGEIIDSQSTSLISIGYNQWDEETVVNSSHIETKNYIKVLPNTKYCVHTNSTIASNYNLLGNGLFFYDSNKTKIGDTVYPSGNNDVQFTTPTNCAYLKFGIIDNYGSVYKNDICFFLYWDGSKITYEPYKKQVVALPNVVLRSAGSVYDELKPDGTLIRRVGSVDLGTLNWSYGDGGATRFVSQNIPGIKLSTTNLTCKLTTGTTMQVYTGDVQLGVHSTGDIWCLGTLIEGTSPAQFKEAMSGVILNYELATPTEEQTEYTFVENVDVDNFGTLEFTSNQSVQTPQAYYIEYTVNLTDFLDTAYVRTGGDANDIALNSELTAKFSAFLTNVAGYDASATQVLKNISGTLTWVTEGE